MAEIRKDIFPGETVFVCAPEDLLKGFDDVDEEIENNLLAVTCIGFSGCDERMKLVRSFAKHFRWKYKGLKICLDTSLAAFPLGHGVFHYIRQNGGGSGSPTYYLNMNPESDNYINAAFADVTNKVASD